MTVDLSGSVWLVGKKGNSYSLFKVVKAPCDAAGFTALTNAAGYCARAYATGRPLLVDISPVDGDIGNNFQYGPGIIGLEGSNQVTFFSKTFGVAPTVIASGKQAWGLSGNEALLGVSLLQRTGTIESGPNAGTYTDNFVVATTTTGRVLANRYRAWRRPFSIPTSSRRRVAARPAPARCRRRVSACGPVPSPGRYS